MSAPAKLKRCSACGREKPRYHFQRNRAMKDGLSGRCRACMRLYKADPAFGVKRL